MSEGVREGGTEGGRAREKDSDKEIVRERERVREREKRGRERGGMQARVMAPSPGVETLTHETVGSHYNLTTVPTVHLAISHASLLV